MTYQLKGGEKIRNDKLYGWTGRTCPRCNGGGDDESDECLGLFIKCSGCGGTGEEWALMPEQPADLLVT